jgi:hypothetical protein
MERRQSGPNLEQDGVADVANQNMRVLHLEGDGVKSQQ